jgi:hypothetical protein
MSDSNHKIERENNNNDKFRKVILSSEIPPFSCGLS